MNARGRARQAETVQLAAALIAGGQNEVAEHCLRAVLARDSGAPAANHMLGTLLYRHGRVGEAVPLLRSAVLAAPGSAEYCASYAAACAIPEPPIEAASHALLALAAGADARMLEPAARRFIAAYPLAGLGFKALGVALQQAGQVTEARDAHLQAVALCPRDPEARRNLALSYKLLDEPELAQAACRAAIAVAPTFAAGHQSLGHLLVEQGRFEDAERCFRRAIELGSDRPDRWLDLAACLGRQGRDEEARTLYTGLLARAPEHAPAHNNLGVLLFAAGQVHEAEGCYRRALQLAPAYAEASNNLGNALYEQGQLDQAEAVYRAALALRPGYVDAHYNLANLLLGDARCAEALEHYDAAVAGEPSRAEYHANRGVALEELARHAEAEASFRRAIALRPNYPEARNNLAHCLLKRGCYEEGWREYEYRWEGCSPRPVRHVLPLEQWSGQRPASGERLLILGEQGLGDQLQFSRYLALAAQRFPAGISVVLAAPVSGLVRHSFPMVEVLDRIPSNVRGWRWQSPLLSLPAAFATRLDTIPASPAGYLRPRMQKVKHWAERIAALGLSARTLRVGLVWQPGVRMRTARLRSVPLGELARPLGVPSIAWFSLQKEPDGQCAPGQAVHWIDWAGELDDFDDTAALVRNLDLVISVDTSVAHLAGAIGVPVWLLNRYASEWRWMWGRSDSPWYPSMRMFNQVQPGVWDDPLELVHAALCERVQLAQGQAAGQVRSLPQPVQLARMPMDRLAIDSRAAGAREP